MPAQQTLRVFMARQTLRVFTVQHTLRALTAEPACLCDHPCQSCQAECLAVICIFGSRALHGQAGM
jgi:hypothetical protein